MTKFERTTRLLAVGLLLAAVSAPAFAWGPRAQVSIVTTAARVLFEQNNIPLVNLERDIRRGASASEQEVEAVAPGAGANLEEAIESQMFLLQAIHSERIDPYMAYRLGLLGKLVAQYTAPLAEADPAIRNLYYADVEKNIQSIRLSGSPRRVVDTELYLPTARRQAQARQDLIVRDYREGIGFAGVAKGSLSQEASRSVDAVADVWHTILTSSSAVGGVSDQQLQTYYLRAFDFYLKRQNPEETRHAYERVLATGEVDAGLRARIGDLYYEAGQYPQAVEEYRAALAQDPGRKDIIQKVAAYFIKTGDEALAAERFEDAVEAYRQAQETDLGNAEAQTRRREAESRINQRETQLQQAQQAVAQGDALLQQADQLQLQRQYGEAIELLQQAAQLYRSVPQEFETENLAAQRGITTVEIRSRELKGLLVRNTGQLSGSGFGVEARRMAAGSAMDLQKQAFQALLEQGYNDEIEQLKRDMKDRVSKVPAP